ncbi:hypothetical protein CHS0354_039972 [Potamilus streckersoni]|uniref:Y+L amino acid transporter 2 n=1 Tax=Potamilus streckersoni TaxID=2493646 RepID=A0AAE0S0G4_9BIVA|nr:hypothetical protein CHS0354_039972 [Potamilus streckersoni]
MSGIDLSKTLLNRVDKKQTDVQSPKTTQKEAVVELTKQINLYQSVAIIVGIIIGSGIFVSPVGILQNVRSVGMSCIMWAVCGIFSGLCALCYAEFGACIPQSGGEYTYIRRAFGDFPAFICLWTNFIIICPVSLAASCMIFATYILQPAFPDCETPQVATRLIAALVISLLVCLNCINIEWSSKVQVVITICKLSALLMIIVIGFIFQGRGGNSENVKESFSGSDYSAGAIAISLYSGFWAYGGWSYLNFLTDELIEPHKNLPRAIIISMTVVTCVYLLANVAYFSVLTPAEMLASSAVAVTFVDQTIPMAAWIVPILIAISVMGTINGGSLSMSRLFFVGAANHHLPSYISMINVRFFTPVPSLITIQIMCLIMQSFEEIFYLIELAGFGFATVLTCVLAGQVYLRYREPDLPRPIKLPIVLPIVILMASLAILVLTVYQKPIESGLGLLMMAAGAPLYVLGVYWERKPTIVRNYLGRFTRLVQKILYVCPQEDGREWT